MPHIAVDLTPILPGGENGGAKVMTIELLRQLGISATGYKFTLLTSSTNHDELAALESHNIRRLCVQGTDDASTGIVHRLYQKVISRMPLAIKSRLSYMFRNARYYARYSGLLEDIGADLLFCPFTAPLFFDPSVPMVSVIYDLQHRNYPEFFSAEERYQRDKHFKDVRLHATKLICISNYVHGTVIKEGSADPTRVVTIHIRLSQRFGRTKKEQATKILARHRLIPKSFLFYPANYWPHKNHIMLLTAFSIYLVRHPESRLKLVLTGAPNVNTKYLQHAAKRMNLVDRIVFAGYVTDDEFTVIMQSCVALIFPSLYEGFGMPVLEAMEHGIPVLCSNVTSLPEVAGDAALLFDPRKPIEIVNAIEHIDCKPEEVRRLVAKGYDHIATFGGPAEMASEYLHVFREVLSADRHLTDSLHGVYDDGWMNERAYITFSADTAQRVLEVELTAPSCLPFEGVYTMVNYGGFSKKHWINRGTTIKIQHTLPKGGGIIELLIEPVFQPYLHGMSDDTRPLGCLCKACRIVFPSGSLNLLAMRADT